MTERPLLALPRPQIKEYKGNGRNIKDPYARPEHYKHTSSLTPQFLMVKSFFEQQQKLQTTPEGAEPEQVIVLETVGSVSDFIVAVRNLKGFELLGEWEEDDIPPDDDFFKLNKKGEPIPGNLGGCLYLIMLNQKAMVELLNLWSRYVKKPELQFETGKAKLRELFQKLKSIRPWGPEDRLIEHGGIDVWAKGLLPDASGMITVQIELWYRTSQTIRKKSINTLRGLLADCGGRLKSEYILEDIQYHSVLAALPPPEIQKLLAKAPVKLIQYDQIMFVRAVAQHIVGRILDSPPNACVDLNYPASDNAPVIGLLDGMPIENHRLLSERVIVDDPDDAAAEYPILCRQHATAMASLILYGDLHKGGSPLSSKLYIRPILRPSQDLERELIPENAFPVAVINEAVHRMFENVDGGAPSAPSVKIINLSVGDAARPFDLFPSPLARLLDWLSFKFNVLFIVSAGNCVQQIAMDADLPEQERTSATINTIAGDLRNRRLLAPAEAVNALTIGALHHDESNSQPIGELLDLMPEKGLVSPISALGFGFRRSVKPDLLLPGGRQFYRPTFTKNVFSVADSSRFGQLVAAPGNIPGDIRNQICIRGTSGATALATRAAGKVIESLQKLSKGDSFSSLSERFFPIAVKALLVHKAEWGQAFQHYQHTLKTKQNSRRFREYVTRFLGYGSITSETIAIASDEKATMLGWGEINSDDEHTFVVPLPPSLAGKKIWKRLTITLAWFSPINPGHRAYRKAALSFEPPKTELQVNRQQVDHNTVRRGTIQHEILEGDKAVAFKHGDTLKVRILCQEKAGELSTKIAYVIAATVEVAEGENLPIWQEVRDILVEIRQKLAIKSKS